METKAGLLGEGRSRVAENGMAAGFIKDGIFIAEGVCEAAVFASTAWIFGRMQWFTF